MSSSRRRNPRSDLTIYLPVHDQDRNKHIGYAVDVSLGGMRLLSPEPVPADQRFHLKVELPDNVLGHSEFYVEAETLWSRPSPNPEFHEAGIKLVDLYENAADVIEELRRKSFFRSA